MLSTNSGLTDSADARLDRIVAEYVQALEAGGEPDRDELLARHPDLAEELRDFFIHRDRMKDLLDPLRHAVARVLNVRCPHCHHAIELLDEAQLSDISCPTCGSSFSLVSGGSTRQYPGGMKRIGQFQLIERVGVGQFGSVWKARDLTLERTVAVKIPRATQLSQMEAELFIRDARLAAKLTHPNIVPVHEVGKHNDVIYIVSDFIQGATLKEWVHTRRLSHAEAARLCLTICRALHHAHECGVVHRDLKPGNVILDVSGEPHLVDFGLAKRDTDEITMTLDGQVLGTPAYMSPEQARGEGHYVDRRADVYSMGVLLFELLTGELPFRGDRRMLIVQILGDDPPSLRRLDNSVPRDLETICLKCLRKEPEKRYSTAASLADDLERWLDSRPILARPVSRLEKVWLMCRRRPAVSTLAALLVTVIITAGIVLHEVRQRERADALVTQLLQADIADAPVIIAQMLPFRDRVKSRLRQEIGLAADRAASGSRLLTTLAAFRLYGDSVDAEWLREHMLTADPATVSLLRLTLAGREDEFEDHLWTVATDDRADAERRFRACCALAACDPTAEQWQDVAAFTADKLTNVPLTELSAWREQLAPVRDHLIGPLRDILQDESEWLPRRNSAAAGLAHYVADDPTTLFGLMMEHGEQQFREFFPSLAKHESTFISLLESELSEPQPTAGEFGKMDRFRRRRALAAVAAWRLNRPEIAVPVLRHQPDPGARTRFIHWAAPFGVDPQNIVTGLNHETDPGVRQALVIALAEFNPTQLLPAQRDRFIPELTAIGRDAADAGLHGAVEWLLRTWGFDEAMQQAAVPVETNAAEPTLRDKQWRINSHGHTMVSIKADDFLMGAPFDESPTADSPPPQPARVGRTYAIASTQTTRAQFAEFLLQTGSDEPRHQPNKYSFEDDHPQNFVSWYDAAAYCNWLSQQEGLPEDEWCYIPNEDGEYAKGMSVAPDFLARRGYRLPTEAEWEFACRAGTTTLRSFGDSAVFMPHYAWFGRQQMQPVGLLRPNGFGLFDMLGNASEWYQEPSNQSARTSRKLYVDEHIGIVLRNKELHGARGGSFSADSSAIDSAHHALHFRPTDARHDTSFRIARTVIPAAHDNWVRAHILGRQGRWQEAAEMMQNAIPGLRQKATARHHTDFHNTLLMLNDPERIAAHRADLLQRFGDTADPDIAHLIVQSLLAAPDCEVTDQIERLADVSISGRNLLHYRDMGMLRFRQAQYESAEDWLSRSAKSRYLSGKPKTLYFLAMTLHARGDESGARETLQLADGFRERIRAQFNDGDFGEKWPNWLLLEVIRREAQAALEVTPESNPDGGPVNQPAASDTGSEP